MRQTVVAIMPEICAWLDANGIRSKDVPIAEVPVIADGQITVDVFAREDGLMVLDPATDSPKRRTVTVPLKVAPPESLTAWLAGKVPAR